MFGNKKNKIFLTITTDNSVDIRAVRDFLIDVVLKKFSFIKHASASFGVFSNNVVAEDYETSRAYENIPKEVVDQEIEDTELNILKGQLEDLKDKIEERIFLN